MSKCTSGVCLMLTLLAIFASAALSTGSGGNIFFVIGTLLMAPMCYFAEKFDGGAPAFYEEIHQ